MVMLYPVTKKDELMSEESKIKAHQLLNKQARAAARRESHELLKVQKAKELYSKNFTSKLEYNIYKERKTCDDVFVFPKEEESIEESKVVSEDLVKIQSKQALAAARREEINQKKILSARRFVRQVSHDKEMIKEHVSKLNFNPVNDTWNCAHTVVRVNRFETSFDETPVRGVQKPSAPSTKAVSLKEDLCKSTFNMNLAKLSESAKKVVQKKNGSVAFEISRDTPKKK